MSVGEEEASDILKHLGPKEVQSLGEAMATMSNVDKDKATAVLQNFNTIVGGQTALGMGSEDYLRNVLNKALGKDKAGGVIDRILLGRQSKGLEALKWMEPRSIAEVIRLEHPQIIAIVLSYLEADQAGLVLSNLPENTRSDIMMRIASLDAIQPAALFELDEILEKQFAGHEGSIRSSSVGGIKTAADILNFVDGTSEAAIMEGIKNVDEDLGQEIEDSMFVFDNLSGVDDRGIQALLREVSSGILIVALKGADDEVKEKILKNMSKRAAEMLRDDLEASGPVKLSEVEDAQREILSVARRMAEAGDIQLGSGGDEYV
ncbi:MAG: flagellar motor switch protein FliG [gamma proteobacterium symbiont of Bathyaustriella thionipta]|nr:flagellar motor switch protein FliG [gamma proteobacterium symbiont of Bathyaustriella thionipta]MCU7949523.1 flagellar motor switch protein FliG [gamma proteobacterium symbiont of Bathyaustriella thionipta]MCU7954261.1 flagellar motor switch protein FliG [gamma proteobacterium symbiont of Bathyaustriella thionipta]MCU7956123.1 flagellar motor switch protein FliG [gamma proteobacterium symbiont of Bathyaustriella thionipta]MCU7968724.1 flagellar motor switch protein FliG [gamma proteobacteri